MMFRTLCACLLLAVVLKPAASRADEQNRAADLRVVSYNLHYLSLRRPEIVNWDARKDAAAALLDESDGDLIALQETETFTGGSYADENIQLSFLLAKLPGYRAAGVGDPSQFPSTQPILIRQERFTLLEQGYFFFSPTPDRIYSRSWDGRYPAFCTWVRLYDRDAGKNFYLYNVHLDAGSAANRRKSTDLILERIRSRTHPDEAVIVAGDFNAFPGFPTLRRFRESGFLRAPNRKATFHFNRGIHLMPAIDHILYTAAFRHLESRVMNRPVNGRWGSDHHPLVSDLQIAACGAPVSTVESH